MVVNVCLFNTDDHLQNFSMVHGKAGWRLSPAYDLVPNVWREEQLLKINGKHTGITLEDLLSESREFGLSRKRALNLTEEVLDGMAGWERLFSEIPGEAAEGIRRRIRKRLGVFRGLVQDYRIPLAEVARQLGVSTSAISKAITRRTKE